MNKQAQLEKSIKAALLQGVETLEADMNCLKKIKYRINTEKEGRKERIMKRINDHFYDLKSKVKRPAVLVCSIAVAAVLMCTFIQPVRVLAQEGINKIASMVYVVVKEESGKYEMAQVSAEDVYIGYCEGNTTVLNDKELAKEVGFDFNAPQALEGGYELADNSVIQVDGSDKKKFPSFTGKKNPDLF